MSCESILQWGIFDTKAVESEQRLISSLSMWLSHSKYASEKQTKDAAMKAGISIPGIEIPFNFDGSYGESHSKYYSEALAYAIETQTDWRAKFSEANRVASSGIVEAWRECQKLNSRTGLSVIPVYSNLESGKGIALTVRYGAAGVGADFKVKIKSFELPAGFRFKDKSPIDDIIDVINERVYLIETEEGRLASSLGGFIRGSVGKVTATARPSEAGDLDASFTLKPRQIEPEPIFTGSGVPTLMIAKGLDSCQPISVGPYPENRKVTLGVKATADTGKGNHFGSIQAFLYVNDDLFLQSSGYGSANIAVADLSKDILLPAGRSFSVRAHQTNSEATARSTEIWRGD
jgi:hypothetical protein